jgi:aryl-phospho-beta-D-glucosidase BglC (GH1 family)
MISNCNRFSQGLLCLLLSAQFALGTGPKDLPKIRVAKDGRGFVTGNRKPFVPFGVSYYRPGTGWAPQVWKKFDAAATRQDFARMKKLGVNCARVFLSYGSFYHEPGVLDTNGLAKFDQFLAIAEEAGIYIHPTGPDLWEGPPDWPVGGIGDEKTLSTLETFWKMFAARYRGRNVLFAYDLRNEPSVGWEDLGGPWNLWLQEKYASVEKVNAAWQDKTPALKFGAIPVPPRTDALKNRELLDFQSFREHLADEWTRRQSAAIKSVDPNALVTVGMIQWSVPSLLPGNVGNYSGFRPQRQARYLDFLVVHFYPLADGGYKYRDPESETRNLAYLESVVREAAQPGKPLVLGEFGWYGGEEKPSFNGGQFPAASETQQAQYDRKAVETSASFACGWLNWGFYDQPEANDCSQLTGLVTAGGKIKAWGRTFQELAASFHGNVIRPKKTSPRPTMDWDACLSSMAAGKEFREQYFTAFSQRP